MALQSNAAMRFIDYEILDDWQLAIKMNFTCANPGPGQPSDYYIVLTDTELAGVSTQGQLQTLVTNKLQRKFRFTNIASRLDQFIGQSITI